MEYFSLKEDDFYISKNKCQFEAKSPVGGETSPISSSAIKDNDLEA